MLKEYAKTKLVFLTGHQFDFYSEIVDTVFFIIKNKGIIKYDVGSMEGEEKSLGWIYENKIKDA
jgi:ascorbate-specific PTS system EIIC-type component UlaA